MPSVMVQSVVWFDSVECYKCGIMFGMTTSFNKECHEKKHTFYCPNGHGQVYSTSEATRLKKMLEDANRKNTDLASRLHGAEIAKGKIEKKMRRVLKRVEAGVCPHCHRTFSQLARHMETKHHEIIKEKK